MASQKVNKKALKTLTIIGCFSAGFLSYPFLFDVSPGINQSNQATVNSTPSPSAHFDPNNKSAHDIEDLDVCFTPNQHCLPQILKYIDNAKLSISLLGYSFTSKPITDALIKAKQRGVRVRIVLDHSQKNQKPSQKVISLLLASGIAVQLDHSVKIAHNKILIIDEKQLITGSYNWSHAAEFNNAENLVFIKSSTISQKYKEYFEERWRVSKPYLAAIQQSSTRNRRGSSVPFTLP